MIINIDSKQQTSVCPLPPHGGECVVLLCYWVAVQASILLGRGAAGAGLSAKTVLDAGLETQVRLPISGLF